jgi:hypothetical protein
MDRKQFLKGCACGVCGCVATGAITPGDLLGADAPSPEDWRLGFVKSRYAKLIEILSGKVEDATLSATLRDLGSYCSTTDPSLEKYRGNFDGYREHIRQTASGDTVSFDPTQGIITITSPERTDCFCPLISLQAKTPTAACNCSLGWHEHTWQTVLGKKVQVELKESVLRGGKRCAFQVRVLDEPV